MELSLRIVAAKAEQLAEDLKNNRLWEGEYTQKINAIMEELDDARENSTRRY